MSDSAVDHMYFISSSFERVETAHNFWNHSTANNFIINKLLNLIRFYSTNNSFFMIKFRKSQSCNISKVSKKIYLNKILFLEIKESRKVISLCLFNK